MNASYIPSLWGRSLHFDMYFVRQEGHICVPRVRTERSCMEQYTDFARVYDLFMDNVPYDEWSDYIDSLLKKYGIKPGLNTDVPLVCELGCGTGSITRRLRDRGYDMIGIDASAEMLQKARDHEKKGDESILYLCQDMREFELYGTVAAVVSVCDSLNYITGDGELSDVFGLVSNYLEPGGLFVFDMRTPYYYSKVLGESTICENRDEGSFIWENYYDPESRINEFDMTVYMRDGKSDRYTRFEETHYQRSYTLTEVKKTLKHADLELLGVFDAFTEDAPARESERVYFVAKSRKK